MSALPELWTLTTGTIADSDYNTELQGTFTLRYSSLFNWLSNPTAATPFWQLRKSGSNYVLTGRTTLGNTVTFRLAEGSFSLTSSNILPLLSSTAGWTTPNTLTVTPGLVYRDLLHSPADIVRQLLVDIGTASLPTSNTYWPASTDQELDSPDDTITLYDTVGRIDGVTQPDGEIDEHYGFQIRLRSSQHTTGYRKLLGIRKYLAANVQNVTVNVDGTSYRVWSVTNLSSVNRLGKDLANSRRRLFTLNGTVVVTPL